ncbi:MAG: DUF4157 domain-containing protein [Pikeienuella sp.]|uniref:eCIS core domain-containing protein n=1 Tax=Pikeienuella sp. TaxID=2831957 RepID=UPI003919C9CE
MPKAEAADGPVRLARRYRSLLEAQPAPDNLKSVMEGALVSFLQSYVIQGRFLSPSSATAREGQAPRGYSAQGPGASPVDPSIIRKIGPGSPLPDDVRAGVEGSLGASFSSVRVHVGRQAAAIGALAFTMGEDIFFAPGQYQPKAAAGRRLLGHELAHVLQQRAGRVRAPSPNGVWIVQDRLLEDEADRLSLRAAQLKPAPSQRRIAPPHPATPGAPVGQAWPDWRYPAGAAAVAGGAFLFGFGAMGIAIAGAIGLGATWAYDSVLASGAPPAARPIRTETKGLGRGQNQHHFLPRDQPPGGGTLDQQFYPAASEGRRSQRSFAGERPKQALRWLATSFFTRYGGAAVVEIQCYYRDTDRTIYVSSNKTKTNRAMGGGDLDDIIYSTVRHFDQFDRGRDLRHRTKLVSAIRNGPRYREQGPVIDAIVNKRVRIVSAPYADYPDDRHAERRIADHIATSFGERLQEQNLAGVKRPCMVCSVALRLVNARAGPMWDSNAGLGGLTVAEVVKHARDNGAISHATFSRTESRLTYNYDTDSDSD